jgi:hypothetical protein
MCPHRLYKQAKFGDCKDSQPWKVQVVPYHKWCSLQSQMSTAPLPGLTRMQVRLELQTRYEQTRRHAGIRGPADVKSPKLARGTRSKLFCLMEHSHEPDLLVMIAVERAATTCCASPASTRVDSSRHQNFKFSSCCSSCNH